MIAGPASVFICDSCVRVCKTIIDRELGEKEEAAKVSAATRIQSQVRRKQADAEVQHARRQKQEALLNAAARPASKKVKRAKKQHAQ